MRMCLIIRWFMICLVATIPWQFSNPIEAAPTAEQTRELNDIKKSAGRVAGMVKKKQTAEARQLVDQLEDRLGALKDAALTEPAFLSAAAQVGTARQSVPIEFVAPQVPDLSTDGPPYVVRIAYLIPENREPSPAVPQRAATLLTWYQRWYADQMQRHGFGNRTFQYETRTGGSWPVVHVAKLARTDSFYRCDDVQGDIGGHMNRILDGAVDAGVSVGKDGEVWWLFVEMQEQQPDGSFKGTERIGGLGKVASLSGRTVCDAGTLAVINLDSLSNDRPYDGLSVPELGPYPLRFGKSFKPTRGKTVSEVASSNAGSWMHEIGHSFGLFHDYRNDDNFAGNLMGNGLRGFRGWALPKKYPKDYSRLTHNDAQVLNLSRYFREPQKHTDNEGPRIKQAVIDGTVEAGLLTCRFSATDDTELAYACLVYDDSVVGTASLSGTSVESNIRFERYKPGDARWVLHLYDAAGNMRLMPGNSTVSKPQNQAPQPFVACQIDTVKVGQPLTLDASATVDPDNDKSELRFAWDVDGDGEFEVADSKNPTLIAKYPKAGFYRVSARVTDPSGASAVSNPIAIEVRP